MKTILKEEKMLRKIFLPLLMVALVLVAVPVYTMAQDNMVEQEQGKILEEESAEVTRSDMEDLQAFAAFFKAIDITFYVDTTYQYVFDKPDGEDISDGSRPLYPENNSFSINAFTTSIAKVPTTDGSIVDLFGFRADILIGQQAKLIRSAGLGGDDTEIDLYQGYLNVFIPFSDTGLDFYAGKFVTLAGFEVIEAKDNPNITRSWLFGNAIPFTHTGIRGTVSTGPVDWTLGLNNGWDVTDDNNEAKTVEAQIAYSYSGDTITDFWFGTTGYFGKEDDANDSFRSLLTFVGSMTLKDMLSFIVDVDVAWENDVADLGGDNANWWGVAGYIVADVHPAINLALRGEVFDDSDGVRIGTPGTGIKVYEVTPTISITPFKGLIDGVRYLDNMEWRFEFRWDHADEPFFVEEDGSLSEDQYGIIAQLLYWIEL